MPATLSGSGYQIVPSESRPHEGTTMFPGGQKAWIQGALTHDYATVIVGRDVGKSVACIFLVEEESSLTDHHYDAAVVVQAHGEASRIQAAWLDRWGWAKDGGMVLDAADSDQDRWLECRGWGRCPGWRVNFWSGQDKAIGTLRGHRLDRLIPDEANQISDKVKAVCWPMLTSRSGKVFVPSTPSRKGPGYAWVRDIYTRGRMGLPGYVSFTAPSECSPFNMPPECDAQGVIPGRTYKSADYMLRKRMAFRSILEPDVKTIEEREEFDAEFIDDVGQVFANVKEVCSLPVIRTEDNGELFIGADPEPHAQYLIGVDWGLKDPSVFSVMNRHSRQQAALRLEPAGGKNYDLQLAHLDALYRRYNKPIIVGDGRDAGAYLGTSLLPKRYGAGYTDVRLSSSGEYDKNALVTRMRRLFQSLGWLLLDVPQQKQQFSDFKAYVPDVSGDHAPSTTIKYGAPKGLHDDIVLASLFASIKIEIEAPRWTAAKPAADKFTYQGVLDSFQRKKRAASGGFRLR